MGPDTRGQNMRGKDMRDKRKDTAGPMEEEEEEEEEFIRIQWIL